MSPIQYFATGVGIYFVLSFIYGLLRIYREKDDGVDKYTYELKNPGYPPKDLTWTDAVKYQEINIMQLGYAPSFCPECGTDIVITGHDYSYGQYNVYTYHCPNGHGWCVDCA